MPVILPPEDWAAWLGEAPMEEDGLMRLLRPAEDALLAFWPVVPRVGRVGENDAALIAPSREGVPEAWSSLSDAPPEWQGPLPDPRAAP